MAINLFVDSDAVEAVVPELQWITRSLPLVHRLLCRLAYSSCICSTRHYYYYCFLFADRFSFCTFFALPHWLPHYYYYYYYYYIPHCYGYSIYFEFSHYCHHHFIIWSHYCYWYFFHSTYLSVLLACALCSSLTTLYLDDLCSFNIEHPSASSWCSCQRRISCRYSTHWISVCSPWTPRITQRLSVSLPLRDVLSLYHNPLQLCSRKVLHHNLFRLFLLDYGEKKKMRYPCKLMLLSCLVYWLFLECSYLIDCCVWQVWCAFVFIFIFLLIFFAYFSLFRYWSLFFQIFWKISFTEIALNSTFSSLLFCSLYVFPSKSYGIIS